MGMAPVAHILFSRCVYYKNYTLFFTQCFAFQVYQRQPQKLKVVQSRSIRSFQRVSFDFRVLL